MKVLRKNTGITLIALIVTIIVLLILTGITVGSLTKDNGVVNEAEATKQQIEKKRAEEQIETAILQAEQENQDVTIEDIIEKLIKNGIIEDESKVNKETGDITTKNPSYLITGKLDNYISGTSNPEVTVPDLNNGNTTFNYDTAWTNNDLVVTITTTISNYQLEYSLNNNTWQDYETNILASKNCTIYARLKDNTGKTGKSISKKIENIDKLSPVITVQGETKNIDAMLGSTVTISAEDINIKDQEANSEYGKSGIAKYYYSIDNGNTWNESTLVDGKYIQMTCSSTGTFDISVKALDKAGNETIIKNKITLSVTRNHTGRIKLRNNTNFKNHLQILKKCGRITML